MCLKARVGSGSRERRSRRVCDERLCAVSSTTSSATFRRSMSASKSFLCDSKSFSALALAASAFFESLAAERESRPASWKSLTYFSSRSTKSAFSEPTKSPDVPACSRFTAAAIADRSFLSSAVLAPFTCQRAALMRALLSPGGGVSSPRGWRRVQRVTSLLLEPPRLTGAAGNASCASSSSISGSPSCWWSSWCPRACLMSVYRKRRGRCAYTTTSSCSVAMSKCLVEPNRCAAAIESAIEVIA